MSELTYEKLMEVVKMFEQHSVIPEDCKHELKREEVNNGCVSVGCLTCGYMAVIPYDEGKVDE